MMNYYLGVLGKYAVFSGRASRSEFWYFALFNMIISFAISFIGIFGVPASVVSGLSIIYMLAVLIPGIAVGVRRLHDTNHSGWWYFILFVPIIGWIVWIVFAVTDSDPIDNQYGPNPKGAVAA